MDQIFLSADQRSAFGSRAAKNIRAGGRIPANLYGHAEGNVHFSLDAKEFSKFLEAGHRLVTIKLGDQEESSIVKEVQYDPLGTTLIHVDFTRVRRDEKIEVEVPIETIGIAKGTAGGGVLEFPLKELRVTGFPQDLPEKYELNIEALEMGQSIRIKDLAPPSNCSFTEDPELVVVAIAQLRDEEAAAASGEEPSTQPEVIGKKKTEEEGESEAKK
jgi:large subunit ribosomal protein L25